MTPYEMRFNYLLNAKDALVNEYHAKLNEAQIMREMGEKPKIPSYPTKEQIFELAEEYKAFAEKK
jgi:hypothetical protein